MAAACPNVSMHLTLIWSCLIFFNLFFRESRAAFPSAVLKSSTTALTSALAPALVLTFATSVPPAKLSCKRPHRPLGSAAVTAMPAAIVLSSRTFHSSGVKLDLFVMGAGSFSDCNALMRLRSPARLPLTLKARHHSTRRACIGGPWSTQCPVSRHRETWREDLARTSEQIWRASFHFAKHKVPD